MRAPRQRRYVHPYALVLLRAVLRYSAGDEQQGYSLTGMFYHGLWNATTAQPERASRCALARPMPDEQPVISTALETSAIARSIGVRSARAR